jgi:hypothetical protein
MSDLISYSNSREPLPCGGNKGNLPRAGCGNVGMAIRPLEQG